MPPPHLLPRRAASLLALGLALLAGACSSTTGGAPLVTSTTSTPTESLPATTTTSEPAAALGKELFVYAPVEGDCIDLRATGGADGAATTRSVPEEDATIRASNQLILRLDCTLPHQYEVIAVAAPTLSDGTEPDDPTLVAAAKQLCPSAFATYVGTPYQDSELELGWFLPSADQRQRGALQIGCLAFDPDGKLTSGVRGSGR